MSTSEPAPQSQQRHVLVTNGAACPEIAKTFIRRHPTDVEHFHIVPRGEEVAAYVERQGLQEAILLVVTSPYPEPGKGKMDARQLAEDLKGLAPNCKVLTLGAGKNAKFTGGWVDGNILAKPVEDGDTIVDLLHVYVDQPEDMTLTDLAQYASGLIRLY